MKKILINFAHPAKSKSKINKFLRAAIEDLENVTVNDLYSNYPDFLIDVKREQNLCEENDVIIFQHPFYWYSTPSIMKEWCDVVLEHGWAYGSHGNALKGKYFLQAITAGGDESFYQKDGFVSFTIAELTSPYCAITKNCKMHWLPPFTVLGIHRGLSQEKIDVYAQEYRRAVSALRDETLDLEKVQHYDYINTNLDSIIRR